MYVLTGATGNTGSEAAQVLLKNGQKVRVLGRSADRLKQLAAQGAEPFVCDVGDTAALAQAFTGARAVYAMIPPNLAAPDARAYQDRVSEALATALAQSGVRHVVSLSSFGADQAEGNGPVAGLYLLEHKLNRLPGLNVLHLRAGYFMENTLPQIGVIKSMGMLAGPLRGDLKVPMIATRDIGQFAAAALLKLDFTGHSTRELLGQRDLTMDEVAKVIGPAIGKPSLSYSKLPDMMLKPALTSMGMSSDVASRILEMAGALNSGHMRALEPRSAANTTPTSFETWVKEVFVPAFEKK
ncbi:MAG TPA: NmrA family NAD(P)-binding protein, partial [Terriglobales bacterium]|nr:NmrA family NAD(P)-binding protein [Terriglobales bacterium]